MFSSRKITESIENGSIKINPFDDRSVNPASYTLHLGAIESAPKAQDFTLLPGTFIIATSLETVELGKNIAGLLSVKGSCSRQGIDALGSDLLVEPGWSGHLRFTISNLGTSAILLQSGMAIVKCIFISVEN